ncbi:protein kinase [Nannocystis sp. ILAH1]|uniref:serine/threonine-protein kinase n=1 Tax=unclassified Nannocystis TaxID=2627009 RepID=UPI00227028A3|nr:MULTISPECIES: serine/threonine-protein kinase [unclassified Nannocystis]MCY0995363.1 protein kinase [Nannocystis sp. ILAH1]MCY1065189.1 protein kinase [Nannocystis sp. RBIL2]
MSKSRGLPRRLGHFLLESEIGIGGMGAVYRALDTRNGKSVALKQLFDVEPEGVYRLKREFRRMADITHENLVALYELCHEDGQWFFTMELLEGHDLREVMWSAEDGQLRELFRQLTRGVHALHQAGKVHRDLKPSNVIVTTAGRVVIIDFGLVDELNRGTLFGLDGRIEGTPAYMAPEQVAGQLAVPASDWYAVGVILFEALAMRWPFIEDPLNDKQYQEAPPVTAFRRDAPRDLAELVARLLRRLPSERPGAAEILRWCAPNRSLTIRGRALTATDLIEREAVMLTLHETIELAAQGAPACVDLIGEAGSGKTAVVDRFTAEVAESGGVVLRGACSPRESVPFRAFDSLLDAITALLCTYPPFECEALTRDLGGKFDALTQVFPVLARVEHRVPSRVQAGSHSNEIRRLAFQGLKLLLYRIAERQPTVIFLDNLQWGDLDSAYLLNHLLGSPGVPPALFINAYRRLDAPLLHQLALQRAMSTPAYVLREVELNPLSFKGTVELIRRLRSTPTAFSRHLAELIARESGGNPALIRALMEEVERGGGADLTSPGDGDLLRRLVKSRLARVSDEAHELYGRVIVADRAIPLWLLPQVGAWSGDLQALIAQLRGQGLIQSAGEGEAQCIESPSEPMQQAALAILDPELLRRSHGDLATAYIITDSAGSARIARHLHAAGRDDEAAEHASAGASAANRVFAFDRAAELYALALECRPDRWTLQKNRAEALVRAGRGVEAAPLFLSAAEHAPAAAAWRLQLAAAEHLFNNGHLARGNDILRPLLLAAGVQEFGAAREARAQLREESARLFRRGFGFTERSEFELSRRELDRIDLTWIAGKGLLLNDPLQAALFLVQCISLGLEAGEPKRIARALALGGLSLSSRSLQIGTGMLEEAHRIAERIRDPYASGLAILCKGIVARHQGQWRSALADIDLGVQYLRDHCPGSVWECGLGQASTMAALEAMGELRVMSERSESLYQRAQALGDVHSSRIAAIYSGLTLLAAGQPKQARARVRSAHEQGQRDAFHVQDLHALKIGVYCDLYERRSLDAWQRIQKVWPILVASGFLDVAARRAEAFLLRARAGLATLRAGHKDLAEVTEVVTQDITQLESEGQAHLRADAQLLRAGLAGAIRDTASAFRHLHLARRAFQETGMGLHAEIAERLLHGFANPVDTRALARLDARMHMQNIVDVDAWLRVASPGLVD